MKTYTPNTQQSLEDICLTSIKAFEEPVFVLARAYYDQSSRMWSILRMPSFVKKLYPRLAHEQMAFKIGCFPSKKELISHLEQLPDDEIPLTLSLMRIKDANK